MKLSQIKTLLLKFSYISFIRSRSQGSVGVSLSEPNGVEGPV